MTPHAEALSRTALLLNGEYFDGAASERAIADGLLETTVRLGADDANLASRAGQVALITSFSLIARMGIGVELAIPDVRVIDPVAPLRGKMLRTALVDLGRDLVPQATVRTERGDVDLTVVLGDTLCEDHRAIRLFADELSCEIVDAAQDLGRITADWPLGAFAVAAAAASIALDVALPRIEAAAGLVRTKKPRPPAGPPAAVDLRTLFPGLPVGARPVGPVDLISGGAITNALLFILLRVPGISAEGRVIEAEDADLSNVNRYMLLRSSHRGSSKAGYLEASSSEAVKITGVRELFTEATRRHLTPLSDRVLVGVDNVEARWWVQNEWPEWLCVGATEAAVAETTVHRPGEACAGCLHTHPLPTDVTIPTISFVSFWAGLLQACELLSDLEGQGRSRRVMLWPFGLGGSVRAHVSDIRPSEWCPLACVPSRAQVGG